MTDNMDDAETSAGNTRAVNKTSDEKKYDCLLLYLIPRVLVYTDWRY